MKLYTPDNGKSVAAKDLFETNRLLLFDKKTGRLVGSQKQQEQEEQEQMEQEQVEPDPNQLQLF